MAANIDSPLESDARGSGAPDGVFPRTFRHEAGEVTIERMPQRIAVISTGQTDGAATLGLVPAGATQGHGTGVFEPYLSQFHPHHARQLGGMVDLGERKAPDMAALQRLAPDLIFVNAAGSSEQSRAALAAIAPLVVTRGKGVNWKADFLLMADALGCAGAAAALLARYHADAASAPVTDGTVSFVHANGRRITIMGRRSFVGTIADDLGLVRPPAQDFAATSRHIEPDAIAAIDADWIIHAGQGAGIAMLRAMPGWGELPAVRAGRAIEVDYQPFFNNAGPTAARIVLDQLRAILAGG